MRRICAWKSISQSLLTETACSFCISPRRDAKRFLSACFPVFSGLTADQLLKGFAEVAGAGKAAAVADFDNAGFAGVQHLAGLLDPVLDQILDGGLVYDVLEGALHFPFT